MKIRLGELKLDDAINLLHQNGLKLVISKNQNELMVNEINPNFEIEVDEVNDESEVKENE